MSRHRNPGVKGLACTFCGRAAESFGHFSHAGMGGVGSNGDPSRHDGTPVCGWSHHSTNTCHGAMGDHTLKAYRANMSGEVRFLATGNTAKRLRVSEGVWHRARWENVPLDELEA